MTLPPDGSIQSQGTFELEGLLDDAWAAWHWVKATGAKIEDWAKDEGNRIVSFVVTIGNDVKTFAVDSYYRVRQAISYVLTKVELAIETLIDWLGFLFSWKDIEAVKADLMNVTNGVANQVESWSKNIVIDIQTVLDQGFNTVTSMLDNADPTAPTNTTFSSTIANNSNNQTSKPSSLLPPGANSSMNQANSSLGASWSSYQLSSGGLAKGAYLSSNENAASKFDPTSESRRIVTYPPHGKMVQRQVTYVNYLVPSSSDKRRPKSRSNLTNGDDDDPISTFFTTVFLPLANQMEQTFQDFKTNLESVLESSMDQVGKQISHLFIQLLKDVLNAIKTFINGFLQCAEELVGTVLDAVIGQQMQIPFLTALWKDFTGEDLPSVLDIICLLAAIPATVTGKLIAGEGNEFWPDLSGFTQSLADLNPTQSSMESAFTSLVNTFEAQPGKSEKKASGSQHRKKNALNLSSDATNWANYSQACTLVHPFATLWESVLFFIDTTEGVTFVWIEQVVELVATTFSFPNLSDYDTEESQLYDATNLEISAWVFRVAELVANCYVSYKDDPFEDGATEEEIKERKAIISGVFTSIESGFILSACAVRDDALT